MMRKIKEIRKKRFGLLNELADLIIVYVLGDSDDAVECLAPFPRALDFHAPSCCRVIAS